MAYTTPRTWVASEVVTAALLNAHLRDNLDAGFPTDTDFDSWSPSWTNLTVGNGTETAEYIQIGKLVVVLYRLVFGSTTSVDGSQPTLSLPVTADSTGGLTVGGLMRILDASPANSYYAEPRIASSTTAIFRPFDASGTYLSTATLTSSVPMTWTTGDTLEGMFFYEAA